MVKKRFSIQADLAKGIRNTVNTASENRGQLHYELMKLDVIELDPENPRKLMLSLDDVKQGVTSHDKQHEQKHHELESLMSLANSIKQVGVRNAIEVYKYGKKYRIISGERRFLASVLAEKENIPVRINAKPDELNLRFLQWIENVQREDLSLWERYLNLQQMMEAYVVKYDTELDANRLAELLGLSKAQAYRYLNLLKADGQFVKLLETKKITNLKSFDQLVSIKDPAERAELIAYLDASENESINLGVLRNSIKQRKKVAVEEKLGAKGRTQQVVALGHTKNLDVVKRMVHMILDNHEFTHHRPMFKSVDWSSPKHAKQAFSDLLSILEGSV